MAAPKGHPKYGGRGKGTANKLTASVKEMIEGALSEVGGRHYLVQQAQENPTAFLTLVGKLLPKDMNVNGNLTLDIHAAIVERARQQSE